MQVLSNDRVELSRYLGLMEEELLMPQVAKVQKSLKKLPEVSATEECTDTLSSAATPTVEIYKTQLELTW